MTARETIEHWLAVIPERIDRITKNKLIVAAGLLSQGISMLFHPDRVPAGMIRSIGTTMILSAAVYLGTALLSKDGKPARKIVLTTLLIAAAGWLVFHFHQALAPFMRYVLGSILLLTGGTGIAQMLQINRLEKLGNHLLHQEAVSLILPKTQVTDEVEKAVQEQVKRNLSPVLDLLARLSKVSIGPWLANGFTFLLGIVLLIYPFQSGDMLFRASGFAITIAGVSDLVTAVLLMISTHFSL